MAEDKPSSLEGCWDPALLLPVAEINEQLLELLRARAATTAEATRPTPRLLGALAELWCALDGPAQRRLAQCPYLLLDGGFALAERWERAPLGVAGVMDAAGPGVYFVGAAGVALVRRTFVLAWHLARANPLAARILLGLTPACALRIAACPLAQLEALAELSPAWVLPRWEAQPHVWRQMMEAALADRAASLRPVQLRGLQLLAGVLC